MDVCLKLLSECNGTVHSMTNCHGLFYVSTSDNFIYGWNSKGVLIRIIKNDNPVLVLSTCNNYLYSFEYDGLTPKVCIFDENTCIETTTIDRVRDIKFESKYLTAKDIKTKYRLYKTYELANISIFGFFNDYVYACLMDASMHVWKDDKVARILFGHHLKPIKDFVDGDDFFYTCSVDCTIRKWTKDNKCVQIWTHYDELLKMHYHNNLLYVVDKTGKILIFGKYFQHHYSGLPAFQKSKFRNWRSVSRTASIQKDISFLFERELLI